MDAARSAIQPDDEEEEFDSPRTIEALATALEQLGHTVDLLGDGELLLQRLAAGSRPDLVFNIAEGRGGGRSREARVPALLEMLGIPYSGSDPLTLAATLDKDCAKRLVASAEVVTPAWAVFEGATPPIAARLADLALPLIAKPAHEGSSKGILARNLIENSADLEPTLWRLWRTYRQPVIVEEFIDGDELTVGIVGNPPRVLGVMRVLPRHPTARFVYSLEVKRDFEQQVRYECPAQLPDPVTHAVRQAALTCWQALGCRDVARIDFRLRGGVPYFLEANPLPGLAPSSGDLVLMARSLGMQYPELIAEILEAAINRACVAADRRHRAVATVES